MNKTSYFVVVDGSPLYFESDIFAFFAQDIELALEVARLLADLGFQPLIRKVNRGEVEFTSV